MKIQTYKNLIVWQRAMELTDEIYKLTKKFPDEEKYSLVSQMRRSAISIPSNIAEGYRRGSKGSYVQFLSIAYGSGGELETQIEICKRNLNFDPEEYKTVENLLEEVMKMLNKLMSSLRATAYDLRTKDGFTIVELLVSMTLFITVIAISSGSFIQILRAQRMMVSLISANNNAVLTLEEISREIRTGRDFEKNGEELRFANARGENVSYRLNSDNRVLEKKTDAGEFKKLTADDVLVSRFSSIIFEGDAEREFLPRITVLISVGASGLPFETPIINLQSSISARNFE